MEALKGLSLISQENTLNNRRNLRSKIEKHSLSINEEFLKSFKTVNNFVENLHEEVNSMNTSCLDMLERIQVCIYFALINKLHNTFNFRKHVMKLLIC